MTSVVDRLREENSMRKQLTLALSVAGLGLAAAALPSIAAGPSTTAGPDPEASATKRVRVGDFFFRSKSITIQSGDRVRWVWVGQAPHNVTSTSGPRRFSSRTKRDGAYRKLLRRRGTYRYICTVHPDSMRGRVVVE
jgi:plastocyanin